MKQSNLASRNIPIAARWAMAAQGIAVCLGFVASAHLLAQGADAATAKISQLIRSYRDGERIAYNMQAINQGHTSTIRYEAHAEGQVERDGSGHFVEKFAWTNLSFNGEAFPLSSTSQQFREDLSLSPQYKLSIPDLSKVQRGLIGPITDLLTFYADVQLAMRQQGLIRPGDHAYIQHGTPNSWADGRHTLFGQDSVDFDITLTAIDEKTQTVTLVVRHVPPAQSHIPFPAEWMSVPVNGPVNNWAQVEKDSGGKYLAEAGRETFDTTIKLSLPSDKIISAVMENPVDVLERDCDDAALSTCGPPIRYRIERRIAVEAVKP